MKKFFALATLITLTLSPLFAKRFVSVALSPSITILNGTFGEYVFANKFTRGRSMLSSLLWETKNVFLLGLDAVITYRAFDFGFYFKGAIPSTSSIMEDSDYLNEDDPDMKVCYSESQNSLNSAFIAGTTFGYKVRATSWFVFEPFINIHYTYFDFTASNGEGWYGSNRDPPVSYDDPFAHHYKRGELCEVDYTRNDFFVYKGATFTFKPARVFWVSHSIKVAAYHFTKSLDCHHAPPGSANNYYFDDVSSTHNAYSFDTVLRFNLDYRLALCFCANYSLLLMTKGDSYSSKQSNLKTFRKNNPDISEAGSDSQTYSFSIGVTYKF